MHLTRFLISGISGTELTSALNLLHKCKITVAILPEKVASLELGKASQHNHSSPCTQLLL